jgi:hypothetical protein
MHGTSILRTRRSRASYGIVYPEIYKKAEHKGREIFKNSPDGKKYVTGRVRWFIKKGDIVGKDFNINPPHELVASFGNSDRTWEDVIVTSRYAPNFLPHYLDQGDCQEVCKFSSNLPPETLTTRRKYMAIGKKFLHGTYEVRVCVKQECLRFETWVNGAMVGSGETTGVLWEYSET